LAHAEPHFDAGHRRAFFRFYRIGRNRPRMTWRRGSASTEVFSNRCQSDRAKDARDRGITIS
jgi:hypothetical protein